MASLTLQYKKPRGQSSGWGSWQSISGVDYCSMGNNAHVVYRAALDLTGSSAMTACQVNTNFVCRNSSASHAATLYCYLYTSDPTTSSPTTPPSGYVAVANYGVTVPYYGINQTFYFSGLNIRSGSYVYFWFTDLNNSSYADDIYNYATGNGYTGTPSCSATFAKAQRTLSVSPASVATGNNVTVSIGNADASETIRFYYGSTLLHSQAISNGYASITCPKSWFTTAGVSTLLSMTVSVTVDSDSSLSGSFTLTAGDNMKPTVGALAFGIEQPSPASTYYPNTYIANISKAKISAQVTAGSNAAIRSVVVTYGSKSVTMTHNSTTSRYEATTTAPITGDTTFTVTATDARGFTGSNSGSITGVVPYSPPAINIDTSMTFRCNSSGVQESGGAYWRAKAEATIYASGGMSDNTVRNFTAGIKNGTRWAIGSGQQTAVLGGDLDSRTNYILVFTLQDKLNTVTREFALASITRNVVVTRDSSGTHVGVGMTPQRRSGGSTIELPLSGKFLMGDIPAQAFTLPYDDTLAGASFGKDFLNVDRTNRQATVNAGAFFYRPQASASEWQNAPATNDSYNWRGYRFVLWYNASFQMVIVFEFFPYPGRIWSNFYNGSLGWTGWRYTQAVTPSS